jgi:hypothetical protein
LKALLHISNSEIPLASGKAKLQHNFQPWGLIRAWDQAAQGLHSDSAEIGDPSLILKCVRLELASSVLSLSAVLQFSLLDLLCFCHSGCCILW